MKVIGITGTLGAGKGTIVDYLTKHHGFSHYSVRSYLTKKLHELHREVNRDTMVALANELREKNSPSFIVEELLREAKASNSNCIIESIRTVGEINALRDAGGFVLFAVDANPKLRYERVVLRGSETDKIDFDTFAANEAREMNSTDPNKQNLSACMAMADYRFVNDNDFDALYRQVDDVLGQL